MLKNRIEKSPPRTCAGLRAAAAATFATTGSIVADSRAAAGAVAARSSVALNERRQKLDFRAAVFFRGVVPMQQAMKTDSIDESPASGYPAAAATLGRCSAIATTTRNFSAGGPAAKPIGQRIRKAAAKWSSSSSRRSSFRPPRGCGWSTSRRSCVSFPVIGRAPCWTWRGRTSFSAWFVPTCRAEAFAAASRPARWTWPTP